MPMQPSPRADTRSPVRPRILEGIGMFVFSIRRRCYYSVSELSCPVKSIPLRCDLGRLRWHVDVVGDLRCPLKHPGDGAVFVERQIHGLSCRLGAETDT